MGIKYGKRVEITREFLFAGLSSTAKNAKILLLWKTREIKYNKLVIYLRGKLEIWFMVWENRDLPKTRAVGLCESRARRPREFYKKMRAKPGNECDELERRSSNRSKDFECGDQSTNLKRFLSSACSANQNGNLPSDHSALTPALGCLLAGEYSPPTETTRREKKRKQKPKSTSLLGRQTTWITYSV